MFKKNEEETVQRDRAAPGPTIDDFNEIAVRRALIAAMVQHPGVVFPIVLGIASGAYALLFGSIIGLILAIGFTCIGIGSWAYRFIIKWDKLEAKYIQTLRERYELKRMSHASDIAAECESSGFEEGAKEAHELLDAYEKLKRFLESKQSSSPNLAIQRYLILGGEAYERGVAAIRQAHDISKALEEIDVQKLNREKARWEKDLALLQTEPEKNASGIASLAVKIESNKKRIILYENRSNDLQEHMARCEQEESALEVAYLELVELLQESTATTTKSKSELESVVQAAKRVEERLRGADTMQESDKQYLTQ